MGGSDESALRRDAPVFRYYRRKAVGKKTLEPNMAPGLFLGWRIDSGLRYRNVVKVLDYTEYRTRGNHVVIDVFEVETYVEVGIPIFPIAHARDKALKEGSPAEEPLPAYGLKEIPFPADGGIASPSTPCSGTQAPQCVYHSRQDHQVEGDSRMQGLQRNVNEAYEGVQKEVFEVGRSGEERSGGCSHCARIISGTTATARTIGSPRGRQGRSPRRTKRHRRAAVFQVKEKSVIQLVGDVPACFGMPATTSRSVDKKKRRSDL